MTSLAHSLGFGVDVAVFWLAVIFAGAGAVILACFVINGLWDLIDHLLVADEPLAPVEHRATQARLYSTEARTVRQLPADRQWFA